MDKFIRTFYKELKESRLWPVAIALALALVAVPLLLSKPAKEGTAVPAAPVGTATPSGASPLSELKPIAEVSDASTATERKSIDRLPSRNPFEPLKKDSEAGATGATGSAPAGTTGPVGATSGGTFAPSDTGSGTGAGTTGGSGSTGGGSGSSEPTTTFYYTFVADVTFGKVDETKRRKIQQLRALPSSDLPVIVFMGATADGDKAVFLVGSGADVTGDGTCKPSDEQCSFLYMKPGDKASIVVGDASGNLTTYELELHKISIEKLDQPPGATSSSVRKTTSQKQAAQISKQQKRIKRIKRAERRKAEARAKGFFQLFDRLGF